MLQSEPPDHVYFTSTSKQEGYRQWWISNFGFGVLMLFVVSPAPEIDEAAVMQLAEMGFPLEACRKAVYYTGNMGPEMAFNWIIAHMEEPGKETSLH